MHKLHLVEFSLPAILYQEAYICTLKMGLLEASGAMQWCPMHAYSELFNCKYTQDCNLSTTISEKLENLPSYHHFQKCPGGTILLLNILIIRTVSFNDCVETAEESWIKLIIVKINLGPLLQQLLNCRIFPTSSDQGNLASPLSLCFQGY